MSADEAHAQACADAYFRAPLETTESAAEQVIAAYLASLRASGYVVVPAKADEATLYEIAGEIARMTEGRVEDIDMASALYDQIVAAAPKFPPEADHG